MKTTKGGKVMNPTDAYRKELRKKELKRVCRNCTFFFRVLFCSYVVVLLYNRCVSRVPVDCVDE